MEEFSRRIESAVANNDYATLAAVFSYGPTSFQSMGQGEQRSLAALFLKTAVASSTFLPAAFESQQAMGALEMALSQLPATVENAADSQLRQMLFEYKVNEGDYSRAARILGAMRMEQSPDSVYYMTPAQICDVYVKIAECFLEEDETVEADSAVTKAGTVVESITNPEQHTVLILRYKTTYARVLDSNRKFSQAATRYHDLSQFEGANVDPDELLQMLGRAATCAILANSSTQKKRVLGLVYKDARLSQLDSIPEYQGHATILGKMYNSQVLRKEELTKFEASLAPHQQAIMGDGLTIMQRAVLEHNMIAVSKIYSTIYFTELARVLGVSPAKAEKIAADMILKDFLAGSINQVEGLLTFLTEETPQEKWNQSIVSFCSELNVIGDEIKSM